MGSPSMDSYAGGTQAQLDLMRHDTFALLNFRSRVHDWNVDATAWADGYREHLETVQDKADPGVDLDLVQRALAVDTARKNERETLVEVDRMYAAE